MKASTLAKRITKAHYGKFSLSKGTCRCMEICVENIGRMLYEQFKENDWFVDRECKHAIDVQLFKIGEAVSKRK